VVIHSYELYRNPNPRLFVRALAACNQVITISEHNKELLASRYKIPRARVQVIRAMVDTENYQPSDKFIILIVAFFGETKGHAVLFKAIQQLAEKDIQVWVVGGASGGMTEVDVRALATDMQLDAQVAFFGALSGTALKAVYQACDVFCLPCHEDSLGMSEGFPVVLMEAMAFGKPVITTRHTEIPRMIPEILIEENDVKGLAQAIRELYQSPERRRALGAQNRKLAEQYFSTHNAELTLSLLQGLAETMDRHAQAYQEGLETSRGVTLYRELTAERQDEFVSKGGKARYFFPHQLFYLPKCGPDGFQSAERLFRGVEPNQLWEILLYADSSIIADLPADLFFDDDIIWHQQQLGMTGHVASANLIVRGDALYTNNHFSDLVQRISRRRECKTRVEKRFMGWNHLLLNGILNFAVEHNLKRIYTPTADLVVEMADPKRRHKLQRELFDRIYDRDVNARFKPERAGAWWVIDVAEHRNRLVMPEKKQIQAEFKTKTICLYHDIERGIAHTRVDPKLAEFANRNAANALEQMLSIEKEYNVRATYSIVGLFLQEIRARIRASGALYCVSLLQS